MQLRWWQNIRWRLALGSVMVALLSASLLALTAIVVIGYYYNVEQQSRLSDLAHDKAQSVGVLYARNTVGASNRFSTPALNKAGIAVSPAFAKSIREVMSTSFIRNEHDPDHLYLFVNTQKKLVYPINVNRPGTAFGILYSFLNISDPKHLSADSAKLQQAITKALNGQAQEGEFGRQTPVDTPLPFYVEPIFENGHSDPSNQAIGAVIVTPFSNTVPAFVSTAGIAVLIATPIIAILVAAAAILYSQTITRPLAKLTAASRVLASGDYEARVSIDGPGELGELAHTFNDMATQLKRDVDELRQQEIWRRELIMNITHDLATPLTAIAGLGEALVDGIDQSHDEYEATGRIIIRETLRLRRLVQDLHVMAKVEAGALQPKLKPLRLAPLMDEIIAVMVTEFERHQIEPINDISYSLPAVVADPDMLTRIISNLCNNSLHYTQAGGTITVDAKQQGAMVVLSVTDTGNGIPPEALTRIFERFYRADNARQSKIGGSGLGLAIVQAIVTAHRGTVWAENISGVGARISFTLPLQYSEQPTHPLHQIPAQFQIPQQGM